MQSFNSNKNTDKVYSSIKTAYLDANVPVPYPAANRQLQSRLSQFVAKGLNDQLVSYFDKVNSNRTYILEQQNDIIQLMMEIKEKDQIAKKLIVLTVDDEIKLIVDSFMNVFQETGFIESAPKCYKRLCETYAISDGRIRIVQRILAKYVTSGSIDGEGQHKDETKGDEYKDEIENGNKENVQQTTEVNVLCPALNDENSPPLSNTEGVTTRSKSILNKECKKGRRPVQSTKDQIKKKQKN